jgi:hypothetical protein
VSSAFDAVFRFFSHLLTSPVQFWFWVFKKMDARFTEPLWHGAPFGCDTLIPSLSDEVVVSNVWPKIAAHLVEYSFNRVGIVEIPIR